MPGLDPGRDLEARKEVPDAGAGAGDGADTSADGGPRGSSRNPGG